MRTTEVTCDGCGADLTTTSNSEDYRLVLASESKPGYGGGAYTDMAISPPIDRRHDFCGLSCLDHWRDRERCYDRLMKTLGDEHKEQNGRKSPDGHIYSWPSPSRELSKSWDEECRRKALAEFPYTKARK